MSYSSVGRFNCDGCKAIESDPIEIPSDLLQAEVPIGWLRVQTLHRMSDLDVRCVHHFCRHCSNSVEGFLAGRRLDDEERIEAHGR